MIRLPLSPSRPPTGTRPTGTASADTPPAPSRPGCRRAPGRVLSIALVGALAACAPPPPAAPAAAVDLAGAAGASAPVADVAWGMVVHGGAGTILRENMSADRERAYRDVLTEALRAGHRVLAEGGSSLDAVEATIRVLEDSPLFNAGRGAVFTAEGTNTLDASIMHGPTLDAGAVAGVTDVRNPISLARLVMERSPHVMLSGSGAEEFARSQGVPSTPPEYFFTERRWESLQRAREAEGSEDGGSSSGGHEPDSKFGTVGAVALDRSGAISAGTSTGGMTNKRWGRIGDSPVIGAGTYAGPDCGVSATGWGEFFIRNVVAYDICARARYMGITVAEAAHAVIFDVLEEQEPETGGVVGLDGEGRIFAPFNTPGMYRGWIDEDGRVTIEIYRD